MENKHGFLVINGQTIGLQSSPARINDYEVSKGSVWSSDKVNTELEDVRNELDVIVEEANKNTTISDGTTSLTTTWSSKKTSEEIDALISDTNLTSTTSTLSASKVKNAVTYNFDTQAGSVKYVKFKLNTSTISVVDIYGGKIEILGATKATANPDYKTVKVVRLSYGDWGSYDATQVPSAVHTKIGELYYYSTDEYYYLKLYNYAHFTMTGLATAPEMITSLPVDVSEMTLIPESQFTTMSDLLAQTANRQVKTFDNSGSSTEKWYKLCSAITGGIGCNIKLTASRADSTATVQYFSALFRDNRYRYTSTSLTRERTVYESELVAEYSAYIVADANNDIWVHAPSCGKVIIEIDTRAITIDGTVGTPVKDYVYSSYESQSTKERLDRMNIKQFNHPGSNTSFKYVTITSTGSGLGGLELNVPYAGKYMFSTPKSAPVYFGSSSHKGYTLNGWAWSDDGKTLYLRVAGFAPFSISVLGSVPNDIHVNNVATISDMTSTAPEGVTFVSTPVYSNAVIDNSSTGDANSTWSSSKIASELKTSSNTSLTTITFDETKAIATSGGHGCTYVIKNGICYVNMDMRIVANGKTCTLPKPLMSVVNIPMMVFMHNITGEVEAVNNGILMVNSDGSATTLGALTNESRYMMNFSYPIA